MGPFAAAFTPLRRNHKLGLEELSGWSVETISEQTACFFALNRDHTPAGHEQKLFGSDGLATGSLSLDVGSSKDTHTRLVLGLPMGSSDPAVPFRAGSQAFPG